jgi:hypothetical protein
MAPGLHYHLNPFRLVGQSPNISRADENRELSKDESDKAAHWAVLNVGPRRWICSGFT